MWHNKNINGCPGENGLIKTIHIVPPQKYDNHVWCGLCVMIVVVTPAITIQ